MAKLLGGYAGLQGAAISPFFNIGSEQKLHLLNRFAPCRARVASAIVRSLLLISAGWLQTLVLPAQNPSDLHRHDAAIARWLEAGREDSFLFYANQKCALAQQADSLEAWAWQQFDAYEAFEKTPAQALATLDHFLQKRWRQPRNANEWLPFLYAEASRGWHLYELGNVWQAVQAYAEAARIFEQFRYPDFDAVELVYKPLGTHYTRLGDDDKALATYQKALALGGKNESLAGLLCNIGLACWNKGDHAAAEKNYRQGLALSGVSPLKRSLLLGALAQTQLEQGQSAAAAATAARSLSLLGSNTNAGDALEYRCYARRTAGVAATQLGRYAQAERLLAGALQDARAVFGERSRDAGKIELARARLLLAQNREQEALAAADRALAAVIPGFTNTEASALAARFYEENTIFEALATKAEAAKAAFDKTAEPRWLMRALECHDLAWQAEMLLRQVYQYRSSKLQLQKDARAREEAAMQAARLLFEKTGEMQWLDKAFGIAERSKAAILLENLHDNLLRQQRAGSDARFGQLGELRQSLSYFDKKLLLEPNSDKNPQWRIEADGIRSRIAQIEQALRADYPGLVSFENTAANWLPAPADFAANEALVEYFVGEAWVEIFVFQGAQKSWRRLPNDAGLKDLLQRYLAFFENDFAILNDPAAYFQSAHRLWERLLPPETAAAAALVIFPDGILNFVPFEALLTSATGTSLRNAPYLIREKEIRYAWSLAVLRQQKNLPSVAPRYLLSVAPGFADRARGLAPLALPDFDWRGVVGRDVLPLHGSEARLQSFLQAAAGYRVLHFSTHAFAGENPRIEFADSSLLLPDLYAMPLQADLVVLSACQTGLGREEKGEGVMSLARAFASAGAACIVSSLWSVNDRSTARLMRSFYQQIAEGARSAAALRVAKLAYLNDPAVESTAQSPYFWAGLVAVGDDRPVRQPSRRWHWVWLALLLPGGALGYWFWRKRKTERSARLQAARP